MAYVASYTGYTRNSSGSSNYVGQYSITVSGNYTPVTGEAVSLLTASNPNGVELNGAVPMGTTTPSMQVTANLQGYLPRITNYTAGTFTLTFESAAGVELAAGAYPAAISGGSISLSISHRI